MSRENNVFVFCNQKGGVGKTTTVINAATGIGQRGLKVLVLDMDPQGNATSGLGVDKTVIKKTIYDVIVGSSQLEETKIREVVPNVDLLPSNSNLAGAEIELISFENREFLLKNILDLTSKEYDVIFIDCPPSLGLLTINALVSAQKLIIPLQCEYYALEGLGQLLSTYNLVKERLNNKLELFGVVLTMADFRTNLTDQVINEVREYFGDNVFKNIVPRSIKLSEAPGFGKPALIYAPESRGSVAYIELTSELLEKLELTTNETKDETTAQDNDKSNEKESNAIVTAESNEENVPNG